MESLLNVEKLPRNAAKSSPNVRKLQLIEGKLQLNVVKSCQTMVKSFRIVVKSSLNGGEEVFHRERLSPGALRLVGLQANSPFHCQVSRALID
jgi:hypothetical protein